jgi:energy-coupling factor transporter ATP-binding protein EcfA2
MTVEQTAVLVVTGASGAGKTTLVRALQATAAPGIACHYFDSIGVPSVEEMIRDHGSGEGWQRAMTHVWMQRLRDGGPDVRVAVLDAQTRPSFVREAFAAAGIRRGGIVLVDCLPEVRRARLVEERGQPELATAEMDMWSAYLRGQADALGLPVLDTTGVTVEAGVARLNEIVAALLAGADS